MSYFNITNTLMVAVNISSNNNDTEKFIIASSDEDESGYYSQSYMKIATIVYAIICAIGLFGNMMVIYVVLRSWRQTTVTTVYVFSLSLADTMFLIGLQFLITTINNHSWIFGQVMCKLYMTLTSINQFASSLLLMIIS